MTKERTLILHQVTSTKESFNSARPRLNMYLVDFDTTSTNNCNVLKSGTLLSATPERHSQNRERRRSATPFYQKERNGSGTHFFWGERKYERPSSFTLFFLTFSFFWHYFSGNKLVFHHSCGLYILESKGTFNLT